MPMTTEICITCGCSESSHHVRECDERCPEDCWGDSDDHTECECGECGEYQWLTSVDPDELVGRTRLTAAEIEAVTAYLAQATEK